MKTQQQKEVYPHTCTSCGSPAYVGFTNNIECSSRDCPFFKEYEDLKEEVTQPEVIIPPNGWHLFLSQKQYAYALRYNFITAAQRPLDLTAGARDFLTGLLRELRI